MSAVKAYLSDRRTGFYLKEPERQKNSADIPVSEMVWKQSHPFSVENTELIRFRLEALSKASSSLDVK